MSDEVKCCPKCGAARFPESTLPQFECGSAIGDILTAERGGDTRPLRSPALERGSGRKYLLRRTRMDERSNTTMAETMNPCPCGGEVIRGGADYTLCKACGEHVFDKDKPMTTIERIAEEAVDRCDSINNMDSDQRRESKAVILVAIDAATAERTAFKTYVHKRLDDAGVPVDPESPHKAEGCRIGGRLDWILARLAAAEKVANTALALANQAQGVRFNLHGETSTVSKDYVKQLDKLEMDVRDALAAYDATTHSAPHSEGEK